MIKFLYYYVSKEEHNVHAHTHTGKKGHADNTTDASYRFFFSSQFFTWQKHSKNSNLFRLSTRNLLKHYDAYLLFNDACVEMISLEFSVRSSLNWTKKINKCVWSWFRCFFCISSLFFSSSLLGFCLLIYLNIVFSLPSPFQCVQIRTLRARLSKLQYLNFGLY